MNTPLPTLTFPDLEAIPHLRHGFSLRHEPCLGSPAETPEIWRHVGIDSQKVVAAEQTHGDGVALVQPDHCRLCLPHVDGLITVHPGITLIIRTADCGPIFLCDPVQRVIGLVHSGRKGTELNIAARAVEVMSDACSGDPSEIIAVLGPCIRPPDYETDFAAEILSQLQEAGVNHIHDCGENTASDLTRFYSYRKEKGQTARHYAWIQLT